MESLAYMRFTLFIFCFVLLLTPQTHKLDKHFVSANRFLWISNTNIL